MKTRFLSQNDFSAVNRIVRQVHQLHVKNRPDISRDTDPFPKAEFNRLLSGENTFALVAEEDGQPVGFCAMTIKAPDNPLLQPHIEGLIEDICVDEAHRKKALAGFFSTRQVKRQESAAQCP